MKQSKDVFTMNIRSKIAKSVAKALRASKAAAARRRKTRAGIALAAILDTEVKAGSNANPAARISAGIWSRRFLSKNGTQTTRLPIKAGQNRARKSLPPNKENRISVKDR